MPRSGIWDYPRSRNLQGEGTCEASLDGMPPAAGSLHSIFTALIGSPPSTLVPAPPSRGEQDATALSSIVFFASLSHPRSSGDDREQRSQIAVGGGQGVAVAAGLLGGLLAGDQALVEVGALAGDVAGRLDQVLHLVL